jgi:hypothetical protein
MRPQDIVVLLKILTIHKQPWQYRDFSRELYLSVSEISESLSRSHLAGLVDESKRIVRRRALLEFIEFGLHYVFPQQPGAFVTGFPTAHSHPFFSKKIITEQQYVWQDTDGKLKGFAIQPLYQKVTRAIRTDEDLYRLLAAIDIVRVGNARELKIALNELAQYILHE